MYVTLLLFFGSFNITHTVNKHNTQMTTTGGCGHTHRVTSDGVRLPTNVIPSKYNVTLVPDLEGCTFQGLNILLLPT
jgi:hypothetical protein